MCFSASASIDDPIINELLLIVEAFTVLFDHFFLILFLQRETNYKCDDTNNSENVTKVCQEHTSRASTTGVHNLLGFEGPLPLWPLFHTFISGGRWPLARTCGYELVTKNKMWMHFSNYFPCHPLTHTYMPIRAIRVPSWSAYASALSGPHRLSDEFFTGPYLTKSPINFRAVLLTKVNKVSN
jgi:hypothetical protein